MRLYAGLLSILFLFSTVDIIPFAHKAVNAKTCCGRKICTCTHARNAACPIKTALKKSKPHCPMAAKEEALKTAAPAARSVLTKAPCHRDTPKTLLPGHPKDFQMPAGGGFFPGTQSGLFHETLVLPDGLLTDRSLDHPPRFPVLPA